MSKTKKIIIILLAIVAVIAALLTMPSAEFDYKVLGYKYKQHLYEKYIFDLADQIHRYNFVYDYSKDEHFYTDYYSNTSDDPKSDGLTFSFDDASIPERTDKNVRFDGRKVYVRVTTIEYDGKSIDIVFEGTKRVFDVYSWKMVENELFPINDESVTPAYDLSFAEKRS